MHNDEKFNLIQKKKVLFINRCLTGGGSEKAMTIIANHFAIKGIDTTMVLLQEEQKTYKVNQKVKLVECFCPIEGNKLVWHVKRILTIRDAIKDVNPDVIITFMWDINMNVILASSGLKKRIIASERCDPRNESRKLIKFAMRFVLPMANLTVFQTEVVRGYYPKKVQRNSIVIPNAISEDVPAPDRTKVNNEIVAVGRLTAQKNFEMLLRSFKIIAAKHPELHLTIYGEGPERKRLETVISELSLNDKVSLPGYVSDVNVRMQNSLVYVNCSNYEGISNAMLEAMAMGIPCVCTDCPVGGAAMVIQNGNNGVLVPVNDGEALSEAILSLIDDKRKYERVQANSLRVREKYSNTEIGNFWIAATKL